MTHAKVPSFVVDAMLAFDAAAVLGYHAIVTPTAETLTGKTPTSVREFLAAHRSELDRSA